MLIEMTIKGLMVDPITNMPIVMLKDMQGDRVRVRRELDPEGIRLHERDREAAGLELARGHAAPLLRSLEPEDVAVERLRLLVILGWHGDEIDAGHVHTGKVRHRRRGLRGRVAQVAPLARCAGLFSGR